MNQVQIDTSSINAGELELINWQFNPTGLGGFKTALWDAIGRADMGNLTLLERAYPLQVQAYRNFISTPNYWQDLLVRAGLLKLPQPSNDGEPTPPKAG